MSMTKRIMGSETSKSLMFRMRMRIKWNRIRAIGLILSSYALTYEGEVEEAKHEHEALVSKLNNSIDLSGHQDHANKHDGDYGHYA